MLQVVLGSGGESTWNFSGLTGKSCGTPNYQEASLGQIVHIQFRTGAEAAITTQYLQRKVLERIMAWQTCMKSCTLMAVLQRHVLHIQSNFCRDGWHVTDGNKLQTSLPHSHFSFFLGGVGRLFSEPNLALGQTSLYSHFHFPARRGHAKIPQGRMLGVVFLLETESRSAAGLMRQHRQEFYSLFFFQDPGFLEKPDTLPEKRPDLREPTHPWGSPIPTLRLG